MAFKPITLDDLGLTPEEMKAIVEGAQKFLPPEPGEEPLTVVEPE